MNKKKYHHTIDILLVDQSVTVSRENAKGTFFSLLASVLCFIPIK